MTDLENLFFELIRVAIGTQDGLSRLPSASEWGKLYKMAQKQSLVGVCFAGLQNLGADADDGFARIGMIEDLYFDWMGNAFMIQEKNDIVAQQCVELQAKLKSLGYRSCVLKGQSAAVLYPSEMVSLRQSGDIDVWVDASRKEIIEMVQKIAPTTNIREHHLELQIFPDTEVEVHYWPAVIRHFLKNCKLQKWFDGKREDVFTNMVEQDGLSWCAPTPECHAVQMMAHMYHHLFDSGIGLRQVLDYYFVLEQDFDHGDVCKAIDEIGMGRFAAALMYVIKTIFVGHEESNLLLCEPNEKDGAFLLEEILRGGNFGRYDTKRKRNTSSPLKSFYTGVFRNLRYLRFNSFDWFWSPLWRIWYYCWRKTMVKDIDIN